MCLFSFTISFFCVLFHYFSVYLFLWSHFNISELTNIFITCFVKYVNMEFYTIAIIFKIIFFINILNISIISFRDLETACTLLGSPNVPLNLGNSGLLSQDPAYEKSPLYTELSKSYRWFDKVSQFLLIQLIKLFYFYLCLFISLFSNFFFFF